MKIKEKQQTKTISEKYTAITICIYLQSKLIRIKILFYEVKNLILKDIQLELKQKYAINGILLYVLSTIFITSLSFGKIIDHQTWNALFWIIMLFASVNAVSKSFVQESKARQLYYYTIASPQSIIVSKIVYNILLMFVLSALCLLVFVALMGNMIQNYSLFITALMVGSFGFASILTMISAIASSASNNFTLMAILSFPIALPLLLTLMKVSKNCLEAAKWADNYKYILVLLMLNLVVFILSYLLFPYLWRD